MKQLPGEPIKLHPLRGLSHEVDLIYYDGPFLSLFRNRAGEPYLYHWCDSDDHNSRWVVFRVSPEQLVSYVGSKAASLQDLVLNPADDLVYLADVDDQGATQAVRAMLAKDLPRDYLPPEDDYYKFRVPEHFNTGLRATADRLQSDVLNVHLEHGDGIQFGSASIATLGGILSAIGNLSEGIAERLFADPRGEFGLTREEARIFGQFHYVTEKAASFSAILRPLSPSDPALAQQDLFGDTKPTAEVIRRLLKLISSATDPKQLRELGGELGPEVLKHLGLFATEVQESRLDLSINWVERSEERIIGVKANPRLSASVIENLVGLEYSEAETLQRVGRFTALDVRRRRYSFAAADLNSSGSIDSRIQWPISKLSFSKQYKVEIARKRIGGGSRQRRVHRDVLISIEEATGKA